LRGEWILAQEVRKHQPSYFGSSVHALDVPPSVFIDNKISDKYTVIEVNGFDRIGFLYDVAGALADLQLNIATAHITTYGEKAVDVFYVKDNFGLKVEHRTKLEQIREQLLPVLARSPLHAAQAG
jgi:[protein-PII] uridylyltransferase